MRGPLDCWNVLRGPKQGELRGSAQTFKGLLAYVCKQRPMLFIYENVDSIDDKVSAPTETNCDILLKSMAALGYAGQKLMTDAQEFGLRRRRRLCVLHPGSQPKALLSAALSERGFQRVQAPSGLLRGLRALCFFGGLLPEDAAEDAGLDESLSSPVASFLAERQERAEAACASLRTLGTGLSSTPSSGRSMGHASSQGAARQSLVRHAGQGERRVAAFQGHGRWLQSVARAHSATLRPSGKHVAPTLLPGQLMWLDLLPSPRLLLGREALLLQGFPAQRFCGAGRAAAEGKHKARPQHQPFGALPARLGGQRDGFASCSGHFAGRTGSGLDQENT